MSLHSSTLDCHAELISSLTRIISFTPPVHTCSTSWSQSGLVQGPLSIAYLFLTLSKYYPNLTLKSQSLEALAQEYLAISNTSSTRPGTCGVGNEFLAWLLIQACLSGGEMFWISEICEHELVAGVQADGISNGWTDGRAGFLWILRRCLKIEKIGDRARDRLKQAIERTIKKILEATEWKADKSVPVGNGVVEIILQLVLSLDVLGRRPDQRIEKILDGVLDMYLADRNCLDLKHVDMEESLWSSEVEVMVCLERIKFLFPIELQQKIETVVDRISDDKRGHASLRKSCYCHGSAVFPAVFKSSDEWYRKILAGLSADVLERNSIDGIDSSKGTTHITRNNDFVIPWIGDAGRAWMWAIADLELRPSLLAFDDV